MLVEHDCTDAADDSERQICQLASRDHLDLISRSLERNYVDVVVSSGTERSCVVGGLIE